MTNVQRLTAAISHACCHRRPAATPLVATVAVPESPSRTSLVRRRGRRAARKPPPFPSLPEGFSPPLQESGWRRRVREPLWFSARLCSNAAVTPRVSRGTLSYTRRAFSLTKEGKNQTLRLLFLLFLCSSGRLLQSTPNARRLSIDQQGAKTFPCPRATPSCLRSAGFDLNIPVTFSTTRRG